MCTLLQICRASVTVKELNISRYFTELVAGK